MMGFHFHSMKFFYIFLCLKLKRTSFLYKKQFFEEKDITKNYFILQ